MIKRIFVLVIGVLFLSAAGALCMNMVDMASALSKVKKGVTKVFSSIDKELSETAGELSGVNCEGVKARKILNELSKRRDYIIDCAFVDTAGRMAVVEPKEYKKYEGTDIGKQSQIRAVRQYKKPVLSNVFRSVEGIQAIDFEYPVFSGKNTFAGAVSMLVRQDALFGDSAAPFLWDKSCKLWVMQKDG